MPPPTLEELLRKVDLVVVGVVVEAHPPEVFGQRMRTVSRRSDIKVVELLKGDARHLPGSRVTAAQYGGRAMHQGVEYATHETMRALQPGDEVVLFLERDPSRKDGFLVAYASAGAIWLSADGATLPDPIATMPTFAGAPTILRTELLTRLRAAARRVKDPRG